MQSTAERAALGREGRHEVTLPGSGITLAGILFRPAAAENPLPAVIVLHGWAERGVPGAPRVEGTARMLAGEGYVALALSMRGWPKSEGRDDCGFDQPDDVAKAAEWVASLPGVDPERVGLLGFSQGGQVALLAGARTRRIKAVVAYYPVTDVDRWKTTTSHPTIPDYVRWVCEPGGSTFRSPVHAAGKISAPVLLIHGDRDTRVPTEQSVRMKEALQKAGKSVELELIPGASHQFTSEEYARAWRPAIKFFDSRLKRR
jgi:dipeptidyl aminopeptidase/acylaminoacyl peptidase